MSANIEHPNVRHIQPSNPNIRIWRYIGLPDLLAILQAQSLHFARADTLGDSFEGSVTKPDVDARRQHIHNQLAASRSSPTSNDVEDWDRMTRSWMRRAARAAFVNCWHANESESQAMWDRYGTAHGSVAIQSTYEKLRNALPLRADFPEAANNPDDEWGWDVLLGMVQYFDYENSLSHNLGGNLMGSQFMSKRIQFRDEREVRAFVFPWITAATDIQTRVSLVESEAMPKGMLVPINIGRLVEAIHVRPGCPPWIGQVIEDAAQKYGWNIKVVPSSINADLRY